MKNKLENIGLVLVGIFVIALGALVFIYRQVEEFFMWIFPKKSQCCNASIATWGNDKYCSLCERRIKDEQINN